MLSKELAGNLEERDSGVPSSQNLYYNDHYISDIDENEEVKQFCFSYDVSDGKSLSSLKSSDCLDASPLLGKRVLKTPQRPVVKLARIRLELFLIEQIDFDGF